MADSDDEYDRRRRDKFRRERSDYDRSREREDRRRDDWNDREWDRSRERRSRGEYRDYDRGRRERFSPPRHELSPPQKRLRRDWDDHGGDPYHGGYDMPYGGAGGPSYGPPQPWGHPDMHLMQQPHSIPIQARLGSLHDLDLGPPPPVMKSFKEFLLSLEDSVDETEAVKRYNEYKLEFRRQQMQDFFLAHKDEEWFRSKYHPDEVGKRKTESHSALRNRLSVYLYLMENGWFENISLDIDKATGILKVLDAAVIKMEGGTDHDLRILEQQTEEEEDKQEKVSSAVTDSQKKEEQKGVDGDRKPVEKEDKKEEKGESGGEETEEKPKKASDSEEKASPKEETETKKVSKKRKRKHSGDDSYDEDDGSASESESESESEKPAEEEKEEEEEEEEEGETNAPIAAESKERKEEEKPKEKVKDKESEPLPRPLHKTCSIFIRSIAPTISKAEFVSLCRRFPGFMRVALSDPQPERRFFRRAWVTFKRNVSIKEICWNLQNIRLRDCELSPVVNRDLIRRVRHVNGITLHKQILRNDIKLSAKLIHSLDDREQLWRSDEEKSDGGAIELPAQNPILKNITDYLIEEVSAEEEELLGSSEDQAEDGVKEGNPTEVTVERDEKLIKVLDRLLLYLRIVHSIDYYNTCEYTGEDEMPNRCGIIHVRGPVPPNRISHGEVAEWQKTFEEKLSTLFSVKETLSEEEAVKMGKKDPEQEVEKFITANTQELGKDKWLCPLSGKKFKGPEFVRKHIFNKHGEKIEEVKKEVLFFNNFLMDAKRPALPEIKPPPPPGPGQVLSPGMPYPHPAPQGLMGYAQPRPPVLGYGGGPPYPPNQYGGGRGNYDNFRGQGGYPGKPRNRIIRGDPRSIIEYRDLDAPEDVDFF
ncbi:serrate RNA effector molecule homolog isoform X2 [Polypterus senegalus]